ncbi:MAG: lipase family protein [Cyanobacteria bacterium J06592_8]
MDYTPPTIPYDHQISKLLIRCCRLGTEQYLKSKEDPIYDGAIAVLESYSSELEQYEQVESFRTVQNHFDLKKSKDSSDHGKLVYYGFVLSSPQNHIVIYRGTQLLVEWIANIQFPQEPYLTEYPDSGLVHTGFRTIYDQNLAEQTRKIVRQLNPDLPCYIAGHSNGASLAVLAAIDLAIHIPKIQPQIQMYCYGCPRVGDPTFAEFYGKRVPNSYRVTNLADVIPLLPPSKLGDISYFHVGQEWSFLNQLGDTDPNHLIATYREAIEAQVEVSEERKYPNSGC